MTDFEDDIKNSLKILRDGGVILYPTDTVWGLGCDATSQKAVEKIFSIKERSESKSLIILVDSEAMLERYVKEIPAVASEITGLSDTAVTIIYPEARNLAPGVASEDGSVGIRIAMDDFCKSLIGRFRKPLVSTSANLSGEPSPGYFGEIPETIKDAVDYVVMYKRDDRRKHKASPVIKVEKNGVFKILRM